MSQAGKKVNIFRHDIYLLDTYHVYHFGVKKMAKNKKKEFSDIARPLAGLIDKIKQENLAKAGETLSRGYSAIDRLNPKDNPNIVQMTGAKLLKLILETKLLPAFDPHFHRNGCVKLYPPAAIDFWDEWSIKNEV